MSENTGGQGGQNWRERVRLYGKQAVTLEEMLRLGFWPPDEGTKQRRDQALAELETVQKSLAALRKELATVEGQISTVGDIEALIAEIRKRRIERVRAERERRRVERAREREERLAADRERRRERPPFLGHGVSAGLRYEGGDPGRVAALGLPALLTGRDVAAAIGIDDGALAWLTYHRGAATIDHYHRFTIPKRSGGKRVISSPKGRLRVAQSWVLRAVLSPIGLHDAAMAFRPARSIADNAALHEGRAIVIRIDLKDFFPSIGFRRVKGLFESFGYNEGVATILALLCTEAPRVAVTLADPSDGERDERRHVAVGGRVLPQGACASPSITNILCRHLDARLTGLARRFGYTYSRYADDLVFSHPDPSAALGAFLGFVHEVIASEGFTVNVDKTRVMRPQHRQTVNGLVVNALPSVSLASTNSKATDPGSAGGTPAPVARELVAHGGDHFALPDGSRATGSVRLSRRDLRRFRAFLHHCKTDGLDAMSERLGKSARAYAGGYLAYIHMVSPDKAAQFRQEHPWLYTPSSNAADTR
jgi:RNA-directed DNA polymerase